MFFCIDCKKDTPKPRDDRICHGEALLWSRRERGSRANTQKRAKKAVRSSESTAGRNKAPREMQKTFEVQKQENHPMKACQANHSCTICGSTAIHVDEVYESASQTAGGRAKFTGANSTARALVLNECARCNHRWTHTAIAVPRAKTMRVRRPMRTAMEGSAIAS